ISRASLPKATSSPRRPVSRPCISPTTTASAGSIACRRCPCSTAATWRTNDFNAGSSRRKEALTRNERRSQTFPMFESAESSRRRKEADAQSSRDIRMAEPAGDHADGPRVNRRFYLPRLAPEAYRGHAVVHWTLTLANRATGWLTDQFHQQFRE